MKSSPNAAVRQQKALAILALVAFFAIIGLIGWRIGVPMVQLASDPESFRQRIEESSLNGQFVFIGMVVLQILAAIIPGEPLEVAAGYAFGAIEGTILCLIGGMIGSFLVILLVRRFGIRLVHVFFPPEKLETIQFLKSSQKRTVLFLLILVVLLLMGMLIHLFPLIARFDMNRKALLRTAFSLTALHLPGTLTVIALLVLPVVLLVFFPDWFLRFGAAWAGIWFSAIAYFFGKFLLKIWNKHVPAED
jgi:hypothetical protein